ncbi:protein of unknown function DUF4217 [Dillenia turbinata]|uniref:ATP-dependent rRNA helicase SPB4-like C-terminal extension domain-containing protein n=1 Tax=Dillenia turbinata TaxID=194707 RepID=A0AAN8ZR27_9MAGN
MESHLLDIFNHVRFVFEAFKKLHPGIPVKCLHGRMKQEKRMAIYSQFCEQRLFSFQLMLLQEGLILTRQLTGLSKLVDCPEDVAGYIRRVGCTAHYQSGERSVLFLTPSEIEMLEKLKAAKVPIKNIKNGAVSSLLAALLVEYLDMQQLAQRDFITYLKSIHLQKYKSIFDLTKLPIDEYFAS